MRRKGRWSVLLSILPAVFPAGADETAACGTVGTLVPVYASVLELY